MLTFGCSFVYFSNDDVHVLRSPKYVSTIRIRAVYLTPRNKSDIFENFQPLALPFIHKQSTGTEGLPPFPLTLKGPTLDLASSHLVCSVALTGVLVLQAGRWWAEQRDEDDEEELHAEQLGEDKLQQTESEKES